MCQICRTGQSILEVSFSLCGPREIEQLNKDLQVPEDASEELKFSQHDTPAMVFAVLSHALARHAFEQGITNPDVFIDAIRIQYNKLYLMKYLGIVEHDSEAMKRLKDYES